MFFAFDNDGAYLLLGAMFVMFALLFLLFTWRESLQGLREFFAPLGALKNTRRILGYLSVVAVIAALIAVFAFGEEGDEGWGVGFVAATFCLSHLCFFAWICGKDLFERQRRRRLNVIVKLPPKSADEAPAPQRQRKVRFSERNRQTSAFKH